MDYQTRSLNLPCFNEMLYSCKNNNFIIICSVFISIQKFTMFKGWKFRTELKILTHSFGHMIRKWQENVQHPPWQMNIYNWNLGVKWFDYKTFLPLLHCFLFWHSLSINIYHNINNNTVWQSWTKHLSQTTAEYS